jgi:hypothetical protein
MDQSRYRALSGHAEVGYGGKRDLAGPHGVRISRSRARPARGVTWGESIALEPGQRIIAVR